MIINSRYIYKIRLIKNEAAKRIINPLGIPLLKKLVNTGF